MTETLVIYHGGCPDGFCAAWQAWRKFGYAAEYLPAKYGDTPPDVTGKRVYIVDFSYPYDQTLQLIEQSEQLVILDHHKTAMEALGRIMDGGLGAGKTLITFDMERSGAGLARDHFHAGMECWLVDYTQDRDLWRFALPRSREVNAYIATLEQTFEAYEATDNAMTADEAAELGVGVDAYKRMYVKKMAEHAIRQTFAEYEDIPVVNAPRIGISELAGELAEKALFAVGWFVRSDGQVSISLRSRGDFDVAELAKRFGGGGHKNAAGFSMAFGEWSKLLGARRTAPAATLVGGGS